MSSESQVPQEALEAFIGACGYLYMSGDAVDDLVDGLEAARPALVREALKAQEASWVASLQALKCDRAAEESDDFEAGFLKGVAACLDVINARRRIN